MWKDNVFFIGDIEVCIYFCISNIKYRKIFNFYLDKVRIKVVFD